MHNNNKAKEKVMAITSEDFRRLQQALEDDTKATRDLVAMLTKGVQGPGGNGLAPGSAGSGGAGGRPLGAAAPGAPATTGDAFWGPGKLDSASGFGLSAVRQALSAGGASGAAGVVGGAVAGFALGGPLGALAGASVSAGASAISAWEFTEARRREDRRSIRAAEGSAYASGPSSDTDLMREAHLKFGRKLGQIEVDERNSPDSENAQRIAAMGRVNVQRQEEDLFRPQQSALDTTRQQLAPLARAGAFKAGKGQEAAFHVADEFYKFNLEQQNGVQEFEKWARVRDKRLTSGAPGAQGAHMNQ